MRGQSLAATKTRNGGKKQIVIGLITDQDGCLVGVEVFKGNTADVSTLSTQIIKIQKTFGLEHVVLVGDHGILKQKQLNEEIMPVGLDWVTAMQKSQIRDIVEQVSAFAPEGTRHYSVIMMNHELIELDALQLQIQRRIPLGKGTRPTWVTLDPKRPLVYVAGNPYYS